MNDKEAQTAEAQTADHLTGQAGLEVGAFPLTGDAVESRPEVANETAAGVASESAPSSADDPAVEPQVLTPEAAWLSADTLPGEVFLARREELRWSLDEAATRLKLTPRQVSALEANDFASLPGMASVRGFVRSYAKALGLDPDPLLDMLAREPNPAHGPMVLRRPLPTKGFPGRPSSPPPRKSKWRKRIILAAVFLTVGFAAGFEAYRSQWVQLPSPESLNLNLALPDLGAFFGSSASAPSAAGSEPDESADEQTADANSEPDKLQPYQPSKSSQSPAAAPALQLKLSEDAWIEITTVSGTRIVSQLIKGGTTASFDIAEPSVLVVGNASAVEARLRGQLLNLKGVARDNVSKLSIK